MLSTKKSLLVKSFLYLIIFHILDFGVTLLFETKAFQMFSIHHLAASDLTLNDLFYRIQDKKEFEANNRNHKEKIFLINTAALDGEDFRIQLTELVDSLMVYTPKALGIDITFSNDTSILGSDQISKLATKHTNIVFASSEKGGALKLPKNVKYGNVDFIGEQHSIRFYKGGSETFANQLYKIARGKNSTAASWESFPILYSCIHDGLAHLDEIESDRDFSTQFHYVNADEALENPVALKNYIRNNIVILGHLGKNEFDVEDKFPVPTDSIDLVNRLPTMYGPVIHANALSNMLDDHFLKEPPKWLVFVATNLVMFLMILLILLHPLKLYLVLGLSVFSIIWISLSIYLMEFNIFIQVGTTLIELLILEEFIETFDPFVVKLRKAFTNRNSKKNEKSVK